MNVKKSLKQLDQYIKGLEKEHIYKSIVNEIPNESLSLFGNSAQSKFKQLYIDQRVAGLEKEKALDITSRMILRSYKNHTLNILKGMENALKKVKVKLSEKAEFVGDDDFPERKLREEIPVIDDLVDEKENEENLEE